MSGLSPLGLYLHIPFCRAKCAYCDFYSLPCAGKSDAAKLINRYTDALLLHMEDYSDAAADRAVDTVFIGGGTPTAIPCVRLLDLIDGVRYNFNLAEDAEITLESNPATAGRSELAKLRRAGVNRLSMGLQSSDDRELVALSRIHSVADFDDAFRAARSAGFDNINLDLMYGIPLQTPESLRRTLEYAVSIAPEHISLYGLKVEDGTPFAAKKDELGLPDEDSEFEMYSSSVEFLAENGYAQYEISNFAREGYECRHNLKYWHCEEYLGLGPAAHSYFGGCRFAFRRDIEAYITAMEEPESAGRLLSESSVISPEERVGEYIMLGLRLSEGIDAGDFNARFGLDFEKMYAKYIKLFINGGFMRSAGGRYSLTPKGMFVSNYIISTLLAYDGGAFAKLRAGTEQ